MSIEFALPTSHFHIYFSGHCKPIMRKKTYSHAGGWKHHEGTSCTTIRDATIVAGGDGGGVGGGAGAGAGVVGVDDVIVVVVVTTTIWIQNQTLFSFSIITFAKPCSPPAHSHICSSPCRHHRLVTGIKTQN
ncbi:hypothetical protein L1987_22149 [Smallanthus sonchifolius]|uniref:Uncharacterized protein n=1 Tax=Smallanthus sonchifolius TaxID=185202 RepID=A0ACB9IE17_9ASTR|nr:hypothetical protein L1987_22149 [Smallanthus sonchifolius]